MTAAVVVVTAAASAAGSDGSHERHAGHQRLRTARGSGRPTSPTARPSSARGTSARRRRTPSRGVALRVPEAARELQARLDRFRAAVAEERARQPGQRPTAASRAPPAADGGTGSTCAAASPPAPRSRAASPGARGRATRRRRRRSDRGSARPSASNSAQPAPALEDDRRAAVDLQHVLRRRAAIDVGRWSSSSSPRIRVQFACARRRRLMRRSRRVRESAAPGRRTIRTSRHAARERVEAGAELGDHAVARRAAATIARAASASQRRAASRRRRRTRRPSRRR